jgi:hypothetical protein
MSCISFIIKASVCVFNLIQTFLDIDISNYIKLDAILSKILLRKKCALAELLLVYK